MTFGAIAPLTGASHLRCSLFDPLAIRTALPKLCTSSWTRRPIGGRFTRGQFSGGRSAASAGRFRLPPARTEYPSCGQRCSPRAIQATPEYSLASAQRRLSLYAKSARRLIYAASNRRTHARRRHGLAVGATESRELARYRAIRPILLAIERKAPCVLQAGRLIIPN